MINFDIKTWVQVYVVIMCLFFPLVSLTVMGIGAHQILENSKDISKMSGNRFTSGDALNMKEDDINRHMEHSDSILKLYDSMAVLNDKIHLIDKRVPDKIPPDWFKAEVNSLKIDLKES